MPRTYTYTTELTFGETDLEVEVCYSVDWGCPETGPSYASGGEPAEPGGIEDIEVVTINNMHKPWGYRSGIAPGWLSDDEAEGAITAQVIHSCSDQMMEHAAGVENERRHDAAEARWEARRDDEMMERMERKS